MNNMQTPVNILMALTGTLSAQNVKLTYEKKIIDETESQNRLLKIAIQKRKALEQDIEGNSAALKRLRADQRDINDILHPRERNRADPPRLPLCTRGVARSLHVTRPQSRTVAPQVLLLPGNRITALHGLDTVHELPL